MKKILTLLTIFIGLSFALSINTFGIVIDTDEVELTSKYKNVILFIGDGMGPNHVDAGGIYLGKDLCFDVTEIDHYFFRGTYAIVVIQWCLLIAMDSVAVEVDSRQLLT